MFVPTTDKNLRPGYGKDSLMFNYSMEQCKTANWTSKMILKMEFTAYKSLIN